MTGADVGFLDYGTKPTRSRLNDEMINAVAANHLATGVDDLCVLNWQCKTWEGNRLNLDDLGDPRRLEHRDKRYALTRRDGQPGYCDLRLGSLPAVLARNRGSRRCGWSMTWWARLTGWKAAGSGCT